MQSRDCFLALKIEIIFNYIRLEKWVKMIANYKNLSLLKIHWNYFVRLIFHYLLDDILYLFCILSLISTKFLMCIKFWNYLN